SVRRLCAAARLTTLPRLLDRAIARIHERLGKVDLGAVRWPDFIPHTELPRVSTTEVLKAPVSDREPGVLFSSYEMEWGRLLARCDLKELARRYTLVLAPSSSPHNLINY